MVDRHPIPVVHKDELFSVIISNVKIIYGTIRNIYFFEIKKECTYLKRFCAGHVVKQPCEISCLLLRSKGRRSACVLRAGRLGLSRQAIRTNIRFVEHCEPPLQERADQSAPFGLDFLDFHGKL